MGFVAAKCTQCGANIEVDESKEAGICKYCGTAFITEKAINNYNTYITNNNNFAGANVTITNFENVDQLIERAVTFEKLNEFKKSQKIYEEITSKYPMDYRGWMGIITSSTKNFSEVGTSSFEHNRMLECFEKAAKVASLKEQGNILKQKQVYERLCKEEIEKQENGKYNAQICNLYDYRDVEEALGCKCLSSGAHIFNEFTFILGNYVECLVTYVKYNGEKGYDWDKSTCEKYVDRTNIQQLLFGYKKKSEKSGCYIATCVYGSYDCPQVWTLRRFRDDTLDATWYGKLFIKCYYAISPMLVKWFGETTWFKRFWKLKLDKLVTNLNEKGVKDTYYNDKY